jgi:dipeptidyl aminopeptidase/acylaminoacyl peptidase
MTDRIARPYGSWKSPITSDLIIAEAVSLGDLVLTEDAIFWTEGRPSEGGRNAIVRRSPDGKTADLIPPPCNARTKVHEYGGGALAVYQGTVYFSNFADQRIYRAADNELPRPITAPGSRRYADAVVDSRRNRLICVCEDHTFSSREASNFLVAVPLTGDESAEGQPPLVSGCDFYSNPRLDPEGRQLAWLSWNHPNMSWDSTELWVASVDDAGAIGEPRRIAGGPQESIFQPDWSPGGILYFVSDLTGWWNLYRYRDGRVEPVIQMEAEFGAPQWVFGTSTYGFAGDDKIICAYSVDGAWRLGNIDTVDKTMETIESPYTEIRTLKVGMGKAVFVGGSPTEPNSIVQYDSKSGKFEELRRSTSARVDQGYLSIPRAINYPTADGLTAHAFFYPPVNRDFTGRPGERPLLIVISHGGPTSAASTAMSLGIQYWTSRGFGVLDVNYGGSTGYGRAYMQRLNGQWGVVDVQDCINGALYLAERGEVDRNRLIIRGGSAGGFTTLAALTFHNVFKAGASYFGISDLEAFEIEGHKFESKYNHSLVGPYPECKEVYWQRSPIHYVDRLSCPVILFQGLEDKVVPPNQAEMMFDAMKAKGLPVAYLPFEGEQHGFRKAENIKRSLDGELYFYSRIFGFELAEPVEPVEIENLN